MSDELILEEMLLCSIGDSCGMLERDYHNLLRTQKGGFSPEVVKAFEDRLLQTSNYIDSLQMELYNINGDYR